MVGVSPLIFESVRCVGGECLVLCRLLQVCDCHRVQHIGWAVEAKESGLILIARWPLVTGQ